MCVWPCYKYRIILFHYVRKHYSWRAWFHRPQWWIIWNILVQESQNHLQLLLWNFELSTLCCSLITSGSMLLLFYVDSSCFSSGCERVFNIGYTVRSIWANIRFCLCLRVPTFGKCVMPSIMNSCYRTGYPSLEIKRLLKLVISFGGFSEMIKLLVNNIYEKRTKELPNEAKL